MALKNYSSTQDPEKSIGQIKKKLRDHGITRFMEEVDPDTGLPTVLIFQMPEQNGIMSEFKIAPNIKGMVDALDQDPGVGDSYVNREQAIRTVWRNYVDLISAQLALVEMNQHPFTQVFFGHLLADPEETYYDRYEEQRLLPEPATENQ